MLKGIPSILTPDLLKILMEMGHGDELVIGDGNFAAASVAKRLVRCDGNMVPPLLKAILKIFPLDQYAKYPVALMQILPGDTYKPEIWDTYRAILKDDGHFTDFEYIDRSAFYDRAKNAFAIVATSETALYANLLLKKGVVTE